MIAPGNDAPTTTPPSRSSSVSASPEQPLEQLVFENDHIEVLVDVYGEDDVEVRVRDLDPLVGPRIWSMPLRRRKS